MAKLSNLTEILKNIPKAASVVSSDKVKSLSRDFKRIPGRIARTSVTALSTGIARELPELALLGGLGTSLISDVVKKSSSFKKMQPTTNTTDKKNTLKQLNKIVDNNSKQSIRSNTQTMTNSIPQPKSNNIGLKVEFSRILVPLKQILDGIYQMIAQNSRLNVEVRSLTDITSDGLKLTKKSLIETRKSNVLKETLSRFKAQEKLGIPLDEEGMGVPKSKMKRLSEKELGQTKEPLSILTQVAGGSILGGATTAGAKGIAGAVSRLTKSAKSSLVDNREKILSTTSTKIPKTSGIVSSIGRVITSPLGTLLKSFNPVGILIGVLTSFAIPALVKTIRDFKFSSALDDITQEFKTYGLAGALDVLGLQLNSFIESFGVNLKNVFINFTKSVSESIKNFDFTGFLKDSFSFVSELILGSQGTQEIADSFTRFTQNLSDKYLNLKRGIINSVMSILPNDTGFSFIDDRVKSIRDSLLGSIKSIDFDSDINKGIVPERTGINKERMSFSPQPTQETVKAAGVTIGNQVLQQNKSTLEQIRSQPQQTQGPVTAVSSQTTNNNQTVFSTNTPSVRSSDSLYST